MVGCLNPLGLRLAHQQKGTSEIAKSTGFSRSQHFKASSALSVSALHSRLRTARYVH
jgi:hypothetical protein